MRGGVGRGGDGRCVGRGGEGRCVGRGGGQMTDCISEIATSYVCYGYSYVVPYQWWV